MSEGGSKSILEQETNKLLERKEKVKEMGGASAIARQHDSGKLTARERVAALVDEGSFLEYGILATHLSKYSDMDGKLTPADGVITGIGKIDGRQVCLVAYDFTVMGGSMGEVGERKVERMRDVAMTQKIPMVWLLDSAGARIQEVGGAHFAGTGGLFYEQIQMSGVVPMVAAIMGPTAAGTSYIPAFADFVPMVKGTSSMALAGAHLVKTAINEDITTEELGGSKVHCTVSGVADMELENDHDCLEVVKRYLSYFPANAWERPARKMGESSLQMGPEILQILPDDPRRPYDMKRVIEQIVDPDEKYGHSFLELKPDFAKNIIVGLARVDGHSIGIVANQPRFMGGAVDIDASDKAARFLWLCDAFNIPVLFLHDCPGFMVGSRMEKMGIIRHGAKFLYAVSDISVPKLSVIVRRSFGAGYYVMCGKGQRPDLLVGWPTSEVGLMSPEGMVNIAFRKEVQEADDPEEKRQEKVQQYKGQLGGQKSAAGAYLDEIIDPRDTRKVLSAALEMTKNKKTPMQSKRRGVIPV